MSQPQVASGDEVVEPVHEDRLGQDRQVIQRRPRPAAVELAVNRDLR
jgi:hypothetical protein